MISTLPDSKSDFLFFWPPDLLFSRIIAVPFGMVPNAPNQPFPAGFNARPAPYGVGFVGAQCSEPKLIELACAFEQATKKRIPPASAP